MFISKNDKPSINRTHPIKQPSRNGIFSSVAAKTNKNLTAAQKELLLWHWKLSHIGFQWLQSLMANPAKQFSLDNGTLAKLVIIKTLHHQTKTCSAPMCAAYQLACLTRKQPDIRPLSTPLPENNMKL